MRSHKVAIWFLLGALLAAPAAAQHGKGKGKGHDKDEAAPGASATSVANELSERDRRAIRGCLSGNTAGLPPGLAKRDRLPPGLERQVRKNGTLPPGLQKRVQPLPGVCASQLPRLPVDWGRVILGRRVLLLDPAQRIVDLFDLDQQ